MNNPKPTIRFSTSEILSLVAAAILIMVVIGAFLLPNYPDSIIGAKTYPPSDSYKTEWKNESSIPIPNHIRNKIFSSDSKVMQPDSGGNKSEGASHLDWVSIEEFRAVYHTATETSRIANYTGFALIIGLAGLALTAVGIYFIRKTLIATDEANKAASKMAIAAINANEIAKRASSLQLQPWISVRDPVVALSPETKSKNALIFEAIIPLYNGGQTPVYVAHVDINRFIIYQDGGDLKPIEEVRREGYPIEIRSFINPQESFRLKTPKTFSLPSGATIGSKGRDVQFLFAASVRFKDFSTGEDDHRFFNFDARRFPNDDGVVVNYSHESRKSDEGRFKWFKDAQKQEQ